MSKAHSVTSPEDPPASIPSVPVTDPAVLRQSVVARLMSLTLAEGKFTLPCVPSMLEDYLQLCMGLLNLLGHPPTPDGQEQLRQLLSKALLEGSRLSRYARLILSYQPAEANRGIMSGITFNTALHVETIAGQYQTWPQTRREPLFGSHPDAKVMAIARELEPQAAILDVGAGPGRNTLPLARLGHPVDAVEVTPVFAEQLTTAAAAESLSVQVINDDILNPLVQMPVATYQMAIATEVVSDFRHLNQVRLFLAKMCDALVSGGLLLFNTFLTIDDYQPDDLVRQMSEVTWSYVMTRSELQTALQGLPLELISDEQVIEYEQKHLPETAWPPTPWFLNWATGRDLFPINGTPPIELRWLLARRR